MKQNIRISILLLLTILSFAGCQKKPANGNFDVQIDQISSEQDAAVDSKIEQVVSGEVSEENPQIDQEISSETPLPTIDILDINAIQAPRQINTDKRVMCLGASLVSGNGEEGITMPGVLALLSGADVVNYGIEAENTSCVAARLGANRLTVTDEITIPSDQTPVEISLSPSFGDIEKLLKYGDLGLNPVTIDGLSGNCAKDESGKIFFTRSEPGEEKIVAANTRIIPYSESDIRNDDIYVIWSGGNDAPQTVEEIDPVIEQLKKIIEFTGSDKYIIISDMNKHSIIPVTDEFNAAFEQEFGEHFLNLRRYLMEDAFYEKGILPSSHDLNNISAGDIPLFFRTDDVHGTNLYYQIAGEQVYRKCQELGYLE